MDYSEDGLQPEFNVGFGINFGGDTPTSGSVTAQVQSAGTCTTCGQNKFLNFSFPILLIVIAVLVLAFRK